ACPYDLNAFLMQIATLIIATTRPTHAHTHTHTAPTFFTAGTYVILGQFIQFIGPESSFLTPNLYLWVFCTCDIISLVVQAIGGGMAATALSANSDTTPGTDIMVAGVVFQMAAITVFLACAVDFMHRVMRRRLAYLITREMRVLLAATAFSITCVYVRSIYRTIELVQGWTGYLITHERYFIALDGAMMAAAVGVFNLIHPGRLSSPAGGRRTYTVRWGQVLSSR
ncbi:hypothetical protein AOCH_006824, partial [Aspergillus ochraceoroseus]